MLALAARLCGAPRPAAGTDSATETDRVCGGGDDIMHRVQKTTSHLYPELAAAEADLPRGL